MGGKSPMLRKFLVTTVLGSHQRKMHTYKTDEKNRQEVIRDLREKLELVEQAINRLSCSRSCVESNATMVKATVLRDISDVLTTLRNREVNLLRQIDLMEARHLNILHTQYAEVHQILGNLKHVLYCVEHQEDGHAHTISDSDMELVANVLKQKVSCDSVTYSRDVNELNTTIQHFGAVATNLSALQVTKELVSKCLPSKLEEYDDGDQQLLYKTLEEIKEKQDSGAKGYLKFPKLSDNKEDWLRECTLPKAQASPTKSEFCFPDCFLQMDHSFWLRQASSCPKLPLPLHYPKEKKVEDWLRQIRQKDALQTESHVEKTESVGEPARGDHRSSVVSESIEMISQPETLASDEFCHVPHTGYTSSFMDSGVSKFLKQQEQSFEWISKKEALSSCCQVQNLNVDIENLHTIPCTTNGTVEDNKKWLFNPLNCKRVALERPFSEMLQLGGICRANELCGNLGDCVCKEECINRAIEMQGAIDKNSVSSVPKIDKATWLRVNTGIDKEYRKWHKSEDACEAEKMDLSEKTHKVDASNVTNSIPVFSDNVSSWLTSVPMEPGNAERHLSGFHTDLQAYLLPIDVNAWLVPVQA